MVPSYDQNNKRLTSKKVTTISGLPRVDACVLAPVRVRVVFRVSCFAVPCSCWCGRVGRVGGAVRVLRCDRWRSYGRASGFGVRKDVDTWCTPEYLLPLTA